MTQKNGKPTQPAKYEYVPRSSKTATRIHKVRKYEMIEEDLDKEIEDALAIHNSGADSPEGDSEI